MVLEAYIEENIKELGGEGCDIELDVDDLVSREAKDRYAFVEVSPHTLGAADIAGLVEGCTPSSRCMHRWHSVCGGVVVVKVSGLGGESLGMSTVLG